MSPEFGEINLWYSPLAVYEKTYYDFDLIYLYELCLSKQVQYQKLLEKRLSILLTVRKTVVVNQVLVWFVYWLTSTYLGVVFLLETIIVSSNFLLCKHTIEGICSRFFFFKESLEMLLLRMWYDMTLSSFVSHLAVSEGNWAY